MYNCAGRIYLTLTKKMSFRIICLSILFIMLSSEISGQTAPGKYWLLFTDKHNTAFSLDYPEDFLSTKSIERRLRQNIQYNWYDLPVDHNYIDSLQKLGLNILNISKWFNAVTVQTTDSNLIDTITSLSFIKGKKSVKQYREIQSGRNKFQDELHEEYNLKYSLYTGSYFNYGMSRNQIEMLNGHILHSQGYHGQGMVIAVLDGGFSNTNIIPALDSMRYEGQILGTRDFVRGGPVLYDASWHGTAVLSTMASNYPGLIIGTAPKAGYWLLRCEDSSSEYIIEEDNWVAAAEFADSVGADIINSSLGYSTYDDESTSHTYKEMDGNSTRVTIGADIAASKGILVVTSASNQGAREWHYITSPADGDSVLTVGAVDSTGVYAYFSSTGPSFDGRVKPNVTAQGQGAIIMGRDGKIGRGNGTSFSSPIIAGITACLWQKYPGLNNMEIIDVLERSSSYYHSPDSLYGYGIPDMVQAELVVGDLFKEKAEGYILKAFPNPFTDKVSVTLYAANSNKIFIEIVDILGKRVFESETESFNELYKTININGLGFFHKGIYFIKITAGNKIYRTKLVKQ